MPQRCVLPFFRQKQHWEACWLVHLAVAHSTWNLWEGCCIVAPCISFIIASNCASTAASSSTDNGMNGMKKLTTQQSLIESASLSDLEDEALYSCVMFGRHAVPVALAFESELFFVLADCVKACNKGSGGRG